MVDVVVRSEDEFPVPDAMFDYPHGLVEFEAPCSSATIDLWFHGSSSLAEPYRKYGPTTPGNPMTTAWYSLPSAVFGTDVVEATPSPR